MKRNKLSETKIVELLNDGAAGGAVEELCRKYQISTATYYKLRTKYAGMSTGDLKRLKELEEENHRLKSMYAEVSLEHKILKEVLAKKFPGLIERN